MLLKAINFKSAAKKVIPGVKMKMTFIIQTTLKAHGTHLYRGLTFYSVSGG